MFLSSKLVSCFIARCTSRMKSQSIAYLLLGSAHINWILDLEGEVHSILDLQSSNFGSKNARAMFSLKLGGSGSRFWPGVKKIPGRLPPPRSHTRQSSQGGTWCLSLLIAPCHPHKYVMCNHLTSLMHRMHENEGHLLCNRSYTN